MENQELGEALLSRTFGKRLETRCSTRCNIQQVRMPEQKYKKQLKQNGGIVVKKDKDGKKVETINLFPPKKTIKSDSLRGKLIQHIVRNV